MVFPGFVRRVIKLMPTILQAVALVVFLHIVGQGVLTRFGSAKYRFSKTYQSSGFGTNKYQKVIKYIDNKIPRYSPRPGAKKASVASTTSTTPTTPRPPPPLSVLEEQQNKRLATLQSTCSKYGLGEGKDVSMDHSDPEVKEMEDFIKTQNLPNRPMWQNLICSKEHKISFCPVFKSASTFLLKKLLLLAPSGKYDKETVKVLDGQANTLARKEFGYLNGWDQYPEFTMNGKTIIFVRHPFERILSAFRDKLEDPTLRGAKFNEYYYNKYGRRIVMHYRKEKITGPTFKYPRFSEFLDFILDRDLRYDDEHWAPFYKECTPCHIKYNFIGHFETLYWDIHLLANKTNLVSQWDDKNDYFQSSTYKKISEEYYSTIDRDVIRKFYKRYKIDFEMFGFDAEEYIKMGKPGPDDLPEETVKEDKIEEKNDDNEVVKPEDIQLNIVEKENDIDNDLTKENVGEVKEILSDEKLITADEEK